MNSLDGVLVVGLTGQTGAGKSLVSKTFTEAGFDLIDADKVARYVQRKNAPCYDELCDYFGKSILRSDGELDRGLIAKKVFSKKSALEALNSICYPYIASEILARIRNFTDNGSSIILIDAPTLFESRTDDFCELIISVTAHSNLRLERIMKRDGISEEAAKMRMKAQLSQKFFVEHSDFVIKNNGSLERLRDVSIEVADKIKDYYSKHFN